MKRPPDPPDAILEEIHETRRKLLASKGGVAGLAAFLRSEEAQGGRILKTPRAEGAPAKRERGGNGKAQSI